MKRFTALVAFSLVVLLVSGCYNQSGIIQQSAIVPSPTISAHPSPTAADTPPTLRTAPPNLGVVENHPILGQWTPVGAKTNGYLLFQQDGIVVRYSLLADMTEEVYEYYYTVEDNVLTIFPPTTDIEPQPARFEILDGAKTLNIYYEGTVADQFVKVE